MTALLLTFKFATQSETPRPSEVKLFAILSEFIVILRLFGDPAALNPEDTILVLRHPLSIACRIGDRGTAQCILNVLNSVYQLPPALGDLFGGRLYRISETDEDSACVLAEKSLPQEREEAWSNSGLHVVCAAHKLHTAAQVKWVVEP